MDNKHIGHNNREIAYHIEWDFRQESLRWCGGLPVGVNIYPIATEFCKWMQKKGTFVIFTENEKYEQDAYSNPYTYHSSNLATILASVLNDSNSFTISSEPLDDLEAEIQCIRIYNELVLYTTRLCEALIKQLLYCIHLNNYKLEKLSLGQLLSIECKGCKASGETRHRLSLLGSLAHRYQLCLPFEKCLFEHLKIVGRRRNIEAAHSEVRHFMNCSVSTSRQKLYEETNEVGNELVHMLEHISDLENRMINELRTIYLSSLFNRCNLSNSFQQSL